MYFAGSDLRISGEVRNTSQEDASALVFLIAPSGMMMDEATPTS
jgi:hypothetical protein